jgi:hypothetical protein
MTTSIEPSSGSLPGSLSNTQVTERPVRAAKASRVSAKARIALSGSFHHLSGRDPITFMASTIHRTPMFDAYPIA